MTLDQQVRICERCGVALDRPFTRSGPRTYCSKTCKAAAKKRRAKTRDREARLDELRQRATACPRPDKRRYATAKEARVAARQAPTLGMFHAYPCRCGSWHVGHIRQAATA